MIDQDINTQTKLSSRWADRGTSPDQKKGEKIQKSKSQAPIQKLKRPEGQGQRPSDADFADLNKIDYNQKDRPVSPRVP